MTMIRTLAFSLMLIATLAAPPARAEAEKPEVVASFSILADLVRQVGGDRVRATTIVPESADPHSFEPKPSDVAALTKARLIVINGLGFESWADRLVRSANYRGERLVASRGVKALSVGGAIDPHAWQDVANVKIYIRNIRDALSRIDPDGVAFSARRAADYAARLDALDAAIRANFSQVPVDRRKVVASHEAFNYFGDAYDVVFLAPQGPNAESEPSAKAIATLVRQIKSGGIRAVFFENTTSPKVIEQIARETGLNPGGVLYADSLGAGASTYIDLMTHNARVVAAALQQ